LSDKIYPYMKCPRDSRPLDPLEGCSECGSRGYHVSIPNPAWKPKVKFADIPELNYTLMTQLDDGIITHTLRNRAEEIARWVANTRDIDIQAKLIELGWTPPLTGLEPDPNFEVRVTGFKNPDVVRISTVDVENANHFDYLDMPYDRLSYLIELFKQFYNAPKEES